jgi:hypothetical protein
MDLDPDPTPDLIPFFSNFKDAKKNKNKWQNFFLLLTKGTLSSVLL